MGLLFSRNPDRAQGGAGTDGPGPISELSVEFRSVSTTPFRSVRAASGQLTIIIQSIIMNDLVSQNTNISCEATGKQKLIPSLLFSSANTPRPRGLLSSLQQWRSPDQSSIETCSSSSDDSDDDSDNRQTSLASKLRLTWITTEHRDLKNPKFSPRQLSLRPAHLSCAVSSLTIPNVHSKYAPVLPPVPYDKELDCQEFSEILCRKNLPQLRHNTTFSDFGNESSHSFISQDIPAIPSDLESKANETRRFAPQEAEPIACADVSCDADGEEGLFI
jgi:hypothetical protein